MKELLLTGNMRQTVKKPLVWEAAGDQDTNETEKSLSKTWEEGKQAEYIIKLIIINSREDPSASSSLNESWHNSWQMLGMCCYHVYPCLLHQWSWQLSLNSLSRRDQEFRGRVEWKVSNHCSRQRLSIHVLLNTKFSSSLLPFDGIPEVSIPTGWEKTVFP